MITAKYLVEYVKKAAADLWGYVGGGQGELYTLELANLWAATRSHSKYYYVTQCKHWFGHIVADCSGLIIAAFRSKIPKYMDQTADYLYEHTLTRGKISNMPEIPGLCVYKKGHIGVYIGNGYVVEARGRLYGVVITKVKDRPWTNWGKLADVDYSIQEDIDVINGNSPTIIAAQYLHNLAEAGFQGEMNMELINRALDGENIEKLYGPKSEAATKLLQAAYNLPQTGYADTVTLLALCDALTRVNDEALLAELTEAESLLSAVNSLTSGYSASGR